MKDKNQNDWFIETKRIPLRPFSPVWSAGLVALYLDRFNAPGWLWGIFGTVFVLLQTLVLIIFFSRDYKDVPSVDEKENPVTKFGKFPAQ